MAVTLNYFIVVHVLGFLLRYISSYQEFLYDCTFSRDLCGWTQDTNSDDFDWIRQHGSTPSADTGPNSDHTSIVCSHCTDYYMYIESSSPRKSSDSAKLKGPVFNVHPGKFKCFSFWYHMYGQSIGALNIYIVNPRNTTLVWSQRHALNQLWYTVNITIPAGNYQQIVIEGIVGPSYKSDIAIDDTQMTSRPCSGEQSTDTTTTSTKITHAQLMSTGVSKSSSHHTASILSTTVYPWWLTSQLFSASSKNTLSSSTRTASTTTTTPSSTTTASTKTTISPSSTITSSSSTTDNGFHGGVRVTCTKYSWDIMIDMNKLRQEYPNAKSSDIYLGDNRCTGVEKQNLLEFSYGFTECLTTNMLHNGAHVYNNELIYAEHDPVYLYIIRHYNWTLGVQCEIQTDGTVKGSVQKPVMNQSSVLNTTQYPVNISYYSDPNFMHQVSGHPLLEPAGSPVYVKVFTTLSDWNIKMRLNTCYTSPTQHVLDHLKYYLIKDGCEVDSNTHIMSQSTHETKFVFENFEYANNPQGGIYVFCDMTFCASSDWSNNCRQTCNPIVNNNP